ncbi:MAG: hypothetical protein HY958_00625 [Bacteroidia bacterium]|nr:hypothetical protein [Bacteroidia bacterium]
MKRTALLFLFIVAGLTMLFSDSFAQSPQLINYQAVARNTGGQLIVNQNISVRISILSGSPTGTAEYSETHSVATNQFGIFNIQIGGGTVVSGSFAAISWSVALHFVKVEADETGGSNYQFLGTSQLISVPYSLYAEKSGDGFSGNYNELTNLPTLFNGTWGDLTGKPTFATVATSGSYTDLLNLPTLFDGTWTSLTGKPTTLSGYGITDAMSTSHAAYSITSTNISNWNTSYGWGNHATFGYLTHESDTMLWKKNGNNLFYNNGNVGIGTTTPSSMLQVTGNATFATTSGNVGIGTTAPGAKLDVNGTVRIISTSATGLQIGNDVNNIHLTYNGTTGRTTGYLLASQNFLTGADNRSQFNGGFIQIYNGAYIQNYQQPLEIKKAYPAVGGAIGLIIDNDDLGGAPTDSYKILQLKKSGVEVSYFNAGGGAYFIGNVGIGTTGPGAKLQIANGDVNVETIGTGIILHSPDGSCYRVTVANGGALVTTAVACP